MNAARIRHFLPPWLLVVGSIVAVEAVSAQRPVAMDPVLPPADFVARELTRRGAPGAVIAVVLGDSVVGPSAYGRVTHDEDAPAVEPHQPFGTVDLQDAFTGLVAAVLAARGTIDLHAPIRTYAPDLPPRLGTVTIAQLLSHTAGLDDAADETFRRPVSKVWPGATDRALFTEPGAIHSPSRHGLPLVRRILEEVAGASYADLLRESVLEPAGMMRTTLDAAQAQRLGAAPAHAVATTGHRPLVDLAPTANPLPQLYTTAGDLARLVAIWIEGGVLDGTRVLPREAFDAVAVARAARPADPEDSVGFGVRIRRFHGFREVSHTGGPGGYGVSVRLLPDAGAGVVTLANATNATLGPAADAALERALARRSAAGQLDETAPAGVQADSASEGADPNPPEDPGAYTGTYANGDRVIVLELRNGELVWVDADLVLPVRRTGPVLEVLVADGRTAQTLRWTTDAEGERYLLLGERAFRRQPSHSARSAEVGSSAAARRAGSQLDTAAMPSRNAVTAAYVSGSAALTP